MNLVQKGLHRDREILYTLEEWGVMDRKQIQTKLFNNFTNRENAKRKAQERLTKLYKKEKLSRWRFDHGFIYSTEESKPGRAEHLYMLNWVRLWIETKLHSWERMHYFQYEDDYKVLRTDGFCAIKNTVANKFRFFFIELDRTHSNAFDKVKKYNKLFQKQELLENRWWFKLTERFPAVLIVTTSIKRKEKILQHIKEENANNLRFAVYLLDDLIRSVIK